MTCRNHSHGKYSQKSEKTPTVSYRSRAPWFLTFSLLFALTVKGENKNSIFVPLSCSFISHTSHETAKEIAHKKDLKSWTTSSKKSIPPRISLSSRWAMNEEAKKIAQGETRTSESAFLLAVKWQLNWILWKSMSRVPELRAEFDFALRLCHYNSWHWFIVIERIFCERRLQKLCRAGKLTKLSTKVVLTARIVFCMTKHNIVPSW